MKLSDIGNNNRNCRMDKHLSQEALAEKANLSVKYISHIELGFRTPSIKSLINIANALEVSADLLLFDLVDESYRDKMCFYESKMAKMSKEKRKMIYSVIDTLISELEYI